MSTTKDYYEILGVKKDAALQEIKKAYRSLALRYHPDRVEESKKKESETKFKEITEAYAVLSDPKKRQTYDQFGHSGIDQQFSQEDIFRGADFRDFSSVFGGEVNMDDILGQLFGGSNMFGSSGRSRGGGARRPQRGSDLQMQFQVTLEEAYTGVQKKIEIPRNEHCTACNGTGAKDPSKIKTCKTCGGRGQVMRSSGIFSMTQTCPECHGQGQTITEYCPKCNGKGHVRVRRPLEVNIPAGIYTGAQLRFRGEGEGGRDARLPDGQGAGDLYLVIQVLPHPTFQRDDADLHSETSVSFVKMALGGETHISALGGDVSMTIPAGTPCGKVFRLKDKGMPDIHHKGHFGDLYVKVMVDVPTRLSAEQKKILEEFARATGEEIKNGSFKDKLRKAFK